MKQARQKKEKSHFVKNNLYLLKLIWSISPKRVIVTFCYYLFSYLFWIFWSVLFIRLFYGALESNAGYTRVLIILFVTMCISIFKFIFDSWFENRFSAIEDEKIHTKLTNLIFSKTNSVDISCFENPDFYNRYTLALGEVHDKFNRPLNNIFKFVSALISWTIAIVTVVFYDPYLILFAIVPIISLCFVSTMIAKLRYKIDIEKNPHNRKLNYISRIIYLKQYAKELRFSNATSIIEKTYDEGYKGNLKVINKYAVKHIPLDWLFKLLTYLFFFTSIMLYTGYLALVKKSITASEFIIINSAMMNALWIMMDMTNAFKDLMESGLYIKNLKSFMGYESKINELQDGIIPQSTIESIEFKNVTFKYDGAQENALQDFNLKVGAGEKIVIVGLNGAGKSTFIKLLMRFYDPSDGNILVNGIDIKEYNLKEYRKLFSAAFQDYQLFSMSVLENVIMKDEDGDDRRNALAALAASGVLDKINTLPKGIDNIVTREFDNEGAVLSGGESQKLIISRALFKDRQIAVFDEPSSALDAVAETRLYDEILKASKGKIIFFISHRLSASLYSDKVLFIDSKNVKAFDTHENLLKENSQYTEMFKMQAERYQESTEADNG